MRTFKLAAATLLLALAMPGLALAHNDGNNGGDGDGGNHGRGGWGFFRVHRKDHKDNAHSGTVTAVSTTSFTIKRSDDSVLTINVDADTKIKLSVGDKVLPLTDLKVNDKVFVKGEIDGTIVDASTVLVTPANTHPAKVPKATVTAVSGSTLTVQTNNHGVISNVTVNTNADTMVKKADGTDGTVADVTVGSTVKVKGFWDEVLNVLKAIKIKIK